MKRNLHAGKQLSGGLSLNILTEDELDEIHHGTLDLLETTGIYVEDETALDRFETAGARVDRDSRIVRIPPHLIEDAIRSAPSRSFWPAGIPSTTSCWKATGCTLPTSAKG